MQFENRGKAMGTRLNAFAQKKFASSLFVATALLSWWHPAHAELTVGQYKKAGRNLEIVKTYVAGLGSGYSWANVMLETRSGAQLHLYCPPNKLAINGENYLDILDNHIKRRSPSDDVPIELILLQGLMETFPCS